MITRAILIAAFAFAPLLPPPTAAAERKVEGNRVTEGVPELPERITERMRQYQNTRSASVRGWTSNGDGLLISTRFGETNQLHLVEKPGGTRRQLTFFAEPVRGAAVCPDLRRREFLFSKDVGGGESYQIYLFDMDSGEYEMVTDGASRNGYALWSDAGDRFVYYSTRRNGRDWDLVLSHSGTPGKAETILQRKGTWVPLDWAPDGRRLLVEQYVSVNESYLHLLDLENGESEQINPDAGKVSYGDAAWARDGEGIYLSSDQGDEFRRLKYFDLSSGTLTDLTADIPWDVVDLEISPLGDRLAFTTNEDGIGRLYLLDTATGEARSVPGVPVGQIYGLEFHPGNARLAFVVNTARTPGDIYVLDVADYALERWTYSEVGGLDTDSFAVPELIHYDTFDSLDGQPRQVPAFYYKPEGDGPHPVLIRIHGGPESQFRPYFSSSNQYYVGELGLAILAPNVRGSAGYGKGYLKLDNGYLREDTVRDIGRLLDWIEAQPELDSERVGVLGGSYGGYMVLAAMTHYNQRLKCAIDVVGISNFVSFLENTKDYRRDLRRVEYGDERDPAMRDFLLRISPTTNAHKITKPLFIAQGFNDPRVPVGESEQMVETIRSNDGQVWYLLFKDEGHGFRKKQNRDYYQNTVVLFMEEHLLK